MSNVFLWHGGRLETPALDHAGVRGIMREVVMKVANGAGLRVAEIALTTREIEVAEEVFLTNALRGVWPVLSIGDRQYRRGALTEELARLVAGATRPGVT
jgi:branched-subunit amino acid aminotransferase/4-amino-4-deoxychorismate lyase